MMVSSTLLGPRRGAEDDVGPEPIAPTDSRRQLELHTVCQSPRVEKRLFQSVFGLAAVAQA